MAYARTKGLRLFQCDINNAYLHGSLLELEKGLYGLKISGKVWNDELDETLISMGFTRCISDPIMAKSFPATLIKALRAKYGVKDEGPLRYILGVAVDDEKDMLRLSQGSYIERVLKRFNMEECKIASTPLPVSVKITRDEHGEPADQEMYRSIIGSVAYVMTCTRPDLSYAISKLSRYLNAPKSSHLSCAKHLLRYLKGTKNQSLILYDGNKKGLEMYVDADHASCLDTRRSTSGILILFGGCPVLWSAKRQNFPVISTTAAELVALAEGLHELLWMRNLLSELGHEAITTPVYEDNQSCIRVCSQTFISMRTKSLDLRYHIARHHVTKGTIKLIYTPTNQQMADILTKILTRAQYAEFLARYFHSA